MHTLGNIQVFMPEQGNCSYNTDCSLLFSLFLDVSVFQSSYSIALVLSLPQNIFPKLMVTLNGSVTGSIPSSKTLKSYRQDSLLEVHGVGYYMILEAAAVENVPKPLLLKSHNFLGFLLYKASPRHMYLNQRIHISCF